MIANKTTNTIINQKEIVSDHGFLYDFLIVGTHATASIAETIITAINALSSCHQINIANSARAKITLSLLVIFLVPYLNDSKKIMKTSKSKLIATDLRLTHEEFNNLIDCPLRRTEYFELLRERLICT